MVKPKKLIAQIQSDLAKRTDYPLEQFLPISSFTQDLSQNLPRFIQNEKFVYQQLLIDCFNRMHPIHPIKDEFVRLCQDHFHGNKMELEMIDEFNRNYTADRAVWWFTRDSCISQLLYQAFEQMDIDLLYASQFLFQDLRDHFETEPGLSSLHVYRAQLMSIDELRQLKASLGELISIDTFLMASSRRDRAMAMLKEAPSSRTMRRVLFEIDVDPRRMSNRICGDISAHHYYTGTEAFLFLPGSIFYPIDISIEQDVIVIQMVAGSDEHDEIQAMIEHLNVKYYETEGETNLLVLGQILFRMGRLADAQKCYQRLLTELPNDHSLMAHCYQDLGEMMMVSKEYETSLHWYNQVLDIYRYILRSNDPEIATILCTIGQIHLKRNSLSEALECYHQAIDIYGDSLGKEHTKVVNCYKSMASACEEQEQYDQALDFYQTALSIREKHLINHRHELAELHRHIGDVYDHLQQSDRALQHYQTSLKLFQSLYPPRQTDVILTMRSIARVYESIGRIQDALIWLKKVAEHV